MRLPTRRCGSPSTPSRLASTLSLAALLGLALLLGAGGGALAQERGQEGGDEEPPAVAPRFLQGLEWRSIGPYRGGRVTAVTGVVGEPMTYYFGATGGGLWKTGNGGATWENLSDGHFATGTVGAIAVAPSDANVLWVGMGESPIRGVMTASGDGVYRSTDGGDSWTHLGLEETRHISGLVVHPRDPDTAWVAAQGSAHVPNPERGIYKTTDGGATWEQTLFVDDSTGVSDLEIDPTNPRILYAATWDHQRLPWKVRSGGPGSGVFKSTDGGVTWNRLEAGLPGLMGKVGVAVSATRPERVWVLAEAEEGGLFRSDDGGKSFRRVNGERVIQTRSWYYMHVFADPTDENTVYVLNAPMLRSVDGGKSFEFVRTPHGDNHDLWIDPEDGRRMINGNDGGANVSYDGGATWSTQSNQPTAQFYRVEVDQRVPYRVYGGQQDNSSVIIASEGLGGIGQEDWRPGPGCESAHLAMAPRPRYVYGGCYQGLIEELDLETGRSRPIMAYPALNLTDDPRDMRYRFNWNAPIEVSPHDPSVIYHTANRVLRSSDRGVTWEEISPDLTRDEEAKQGPGGGPITNEGAGGEVYGTILSFTPSPHEPGTLWAGSDDGLVHVTRDGGGTWQEVTPPNLPEAMINTIEVSPHDPAGAYLAVTRYKLGDEAPYAFKTSDYGATWTQIAGGIPDRAFVRAVREDPVRAGLLYMATERGVFVSFDGGERWQSLQGNLPPVPVTDLAVAGGDARSDLVAATQGRAFWILDDLSPLRRLDEELFEADLAVLPPRPAIQMAQGADNRTGQPVAANPPRGAVIHYVLSEELAGHLGGGPGGGPGSADGESAEGADETDADETDAEEMEAEELAEAGDDPAAGKKKKEEASKGPELILEILDDRGEVVFETSSRPEPSAGGGAMAFFFGGGGRPPLPTRPGLNRFVWDFSGGEITQIPDGVAVFGPSESWNHPPGSYTVRLRVGEAEETAGEEMVGEEMAGEETTGEEMTEGEGGEELPERFAGLERSAPLVVLDDPGLDRPAQAFADQLALARQVGGDLSALYEAVLQAREVREQVRSLVDRSEHLDDGGEEIAEAGEEVVRELTAWEETVIQIKARNFQDIINYPGSLDGELAFLLGVVEGGPPIAAGTRQRADELHRQWLDRRAALDQILDGPVAELNRRMAERQPPAILVPPAGAEVDER